MINIHYALQTCDTKSYQSQKRFCGDDKTELSMKSVKSFLQSIKHCSELKKDAIHNIAIIDDHSTEKLKVYHKKCKQDLETDNIKIELINLSDKQGISASIRECYKWLDVNGTDLVYQVQDDYIFIEQAIYEMIDIFYQIFCETENHCIVSPFNDPYLWNAVYKNKVVPRTVVVGKHRYWIQNYDTSCSFLTSHYQFKQHWDLYDKFLYLTEYKDKGLESKSLNYLFTQRGILGLVPINSMAFHMQSDFEKDPYIDWKPIWDSINVTSATT